MFSLWGGMPPWTFWRASKTARPRALHKTVPVLVVGAESNQVTVRTSFYLPWCALKKCLPLLLQKIPPRKKKTDQQKHINHHSEKKENKFDHTISYNHLMNHQFQLNHHQPLRTPKKTHQFTSWLPPTAGCHRRCLGSCFGRQVSGGSSRASPTNRWSRSSSWPRCARWTRLVRHFCSSAVGFDIKLMFQLTKTIPLLLKT